MSHFRILTIAGLWCWMTAAAIAQPNNTTAPKRPAWPPMSATDARAVGALFLGMCVDHFGRGEITWAEQACGEAIEANPREVDAYKMRGYIYLFDHRFAQAAQDFRTSLHLRPRDDQEIAGYGQSMSGLGKFKAAIAQFRKAISLAPQKAVYWNGLCWALAGDGHRLQEALSSCNRALTLIPDAPGILNSRAMVYLHMKYFTLAIADYTKSLDVQQHQASAWFGRGLARLNLTQQDGIADIVEARRRDPAIDQLFVQMGVLQTGCSGKAESKARSACPDGFPPIQLNKPGDNVTALLHADPDEELAMAVRISGTEAQK